ncbi:hypothetical protein [Glycomyces algeriensis]|uniref:Uncharacterized protein n=1 Tax=Glycomyces algeriensis TaxID=256037 RepID=A0A9W6LIB6_9ACTN|nr:hypothetical protein [Glycomyces algeriensis]MDA1366529.1 hypothetical protein [Glycomyces algeriensis]MDR7352187.1 hypothetical protein [Glycomyces algeriensis]GLI44922.1 hypothetical protein GALLR39Z86_47720 [Glycomyces algeriensis]
MSQDQWGPRYGDPTHPTTGELPRVGDGRTDEQRTIQVDTVPEEPPQQSRSRYRYSWESAAPGDAEPAGSHSEPGHGFSEPRYGASEPGHGFSEPRYAASEPRHGFSEPRYAASEPRHGSSQPESSADPAESGFGDWSVPRVGRESAASGLTGEHSRPSLSGYRPGDTAQFARVGDGVRGSVGPVSVQIDHVRVDNGVNGDTQLLDTTNFRRPQETEIAPAEQAPQPEPGTGSMPAMRHQIGPDWTQTPLRLLAAAVVATAVLGASAASLITIGNWINP